MQDAGAWPCLFGGAVAKAVVQEAPQNEAQAILSFICVILIAGATVAFGLSCHHLVIHHRWSIAHAVLGRVLFFV